MHNHVHVHAQPLTVTLTMCFYLLFKVNKHVFMNILSFQCDSWSQTHENISKYIKLLILKMLKLWSNRYYIVHTMCFHLLFKVNKHVFMNILSFYCDSWSQTHETCADTPSRFFSWVTSSLFKLHVFKILYVLLYYCTLFTPHFIHSRPSTLASASHEMKSVYKPLRFIYMWS